MSKLKCHLNSNVTKNNTLEKLKCHKKTETSQKNETAQKMQCKDCLDQQFCRVKSALLHKGGVKKTCLFIHILWISILPPPPYPRWRIL